MLRCIKTLDTRGVLMILYCLLNRGISFAIFHKC